jgi:hypothetical protein
MNGIQVEKIKLTRERRRKKKHKEGRQFLHIENSNDKSMSFK